MIVFFLKFFIALVGLMLTFGYLIVGLIKRNKTNFKIAGVAFLTTVGTIVVVTAIEFLFHDKNKDYLDKETVLVAMREASLGGIHLKVYVDSTFDLGNEGKVTMRGNIKVHRDTLFLLQGDSTARSFVLDKTFLKEIKDTGIRFLQIESNEILNVD